MDINLGFECTINIHCSQYGVTFGALHDFLQGTLYRAAPTKSTFANATLQQHMMFPNDSVPSLSFLHSLSFFSHSWIILSFYNR